jgi:hypothetical protein
VKPVGVAHIASFLSPFPFHTRSLLLHYYDIRFIFYFATMVNAAQCLRRRWSL